MYSGKRFFLALGIVFAFSTANATVPADKLWVQRTSNQTIADMTTTTVVFDGVQFDTNSSYSTSTGIWTAPQTGRIHVFAQVAYVNPTAGTYQAGIFLNGSFSVAASANSHNGTGDLISLPMELEFPVTMGQTIQIKTRQFTGQNQTLYDGTFSQGDSTFMSIYYTE